MSSRKDVEEMVEKNYNYLYTAFFLRMSCEQISIYICDSVTEVYLSSLEL